LKRPPLAAPSELERGKRSRWLDCAWSGGEPIEKFRETFNTCRLFSRIGKEGATTSDVYGKNVVVKTKGVKAKLHKIRNVCAFA
jgi:hypothetical protein